VRVTYSADIEGRKRTMVGRDAVKIDLSGTSQDLVHMGVLDDRFVLPPEKVIQLQEELDMTIDELLRAMITPASSLARPPISSFHVGCVVCCCCSCRRYVV